MNIVFWAIIAFVLVLVWFLLAFAFKGVGGVALKLFNDAKDEIVGEAHAEEKEKNEIES